MLVHLNLILHHIHIALVTLIIKSEYIGAPKPPVLHQHTCCICNFIIELGMLVPPNLLLHHIHVKLASDLDAI
jgi:hypothetical protein